MVNLAKEVALRHQVLFFVELEKIQASKDHPRATIRPPPA